MSDESPRRPGSQPSSSTTDPSFDGLSYAVLRRYVAGTSDQAERRLVAAWADASPARRSYLEALGRIWERGQGVAETERAAADAAWAALYVQLEVPPAEPDVQFTPAWEQTPVEIDVRRHRPVRLLTNAFGSRRRLPLIRAAAAVLLVAGGVWVAQSPVRKWAGGEPPASVAEREVVTGPGQRAQVKLGDGSTVTLAGKSRLRFPADFGARSRELQLDGQAYFLVVHDSARPFVVNAGNSRTVDVGTAFVLRAYPEDRGARVVVEEGSVLFGARPRPGPRAATSESSRRVLLTEGWMGRLTSDTAAPLVLKVDPARFTGWLAGRLVFDDTPLAEVAAELERWYDVEIRFADPSLARETFTASFKAESLSETLRTLTAVVQLRAERAGRVVILHRQAR